jgi:hypothetical protein
MTATKSTLTDAEIDAAYQRYEERLATEPLAVSVRYLPSRDVVVIEMNNGASLVIPRRLLQGLSEASQAHLRHATIAASGTCLRWPDLDADFTIMGLLHGIYGGKKWMSELARHAGQATSDAKAIAARINGAKGGRPRKGATSSERAK